MHGDRGTVVTADDAQIDDLDPLGHARLDDDPVERQLVCCRRSLAMPGKVVKGVDLKSAAIEAGTSRAIQSLQYRVGP